VRDQLQDVGIRLELKVMGDTEFMDFARGGGPSLILSRFGAPTGDASDILDTALHSQSPALAMGIGNFGGYSNPVVDRAIEESAGIETLKARGAALRAIMSLVMEDLPWAPLYVDQDVYAISKALAWRPRNDSFILAAEVSRRR
jgi:peptide/nickel transport system substrate-binding protein